MRFLYKLRASRLEMLTVGPTPEEQATIPRHAAHLQQLASDGRVHHFGRTMNNDEKTVGLVVFDAEDAEEAEKFVHADPAIVSGVMRGELFPYQQVYPS